MRAGTGGTHVGAGRTHVMMNVLRLADQLVYGWRLPVCLPTSELILYPLPLTESTAYSHAVC